MKSLYPRLNYHFNLFWLAACWWRFGVKAKSFLQDLKAHFSNDLVFPVPSARYGVFRALSSLPPRTRVGVQPFTCPTVFEAIVAAGASIVFVDIDEGLKLSETSLRVKKDEIDVLVLTHMFGNVADVSAYRDIIGAQKLIIEDCAHAFLSPNAGLKGDLSVFSFGMAKFPASFYGGAVVVNNPVFKPCFLNFETLSISQEFRIWLKSLPMRLLHQPVLYATIGVSLKKNRKLTYSLLTRFDASNRISKLSYSFLNFFFKRKDAYLIRQQSNHTLLCEAIQQSSYFTLCQQSSSFNGFMVAALTDNPDKVLGYFETHGIELGKHFVATYAALPVFGYKDGECPVYENINVKLITFPCHYLYSGRMINKMASLIVGYK
jgi:perosamine synthetase